MARTLSRTGRSAPSASEYARTDVDSSDAPRPARKVSLRGWDAVEEQKKRGGNSKFADVLQVTDQPQIIAFLEDEPYACYREHWVKRDGKQSFFCHGDECPLCEVITDRKPQLRALFNVVSFADGDPKVVTLRAGRQLVDLITDWAESKRTSPINREDIYWAISRIETGTGANKRYQYKLTPVKKRDLEEDHGIEPLTDQERAELMKQLTTEESVYIDSIEDLEELAAEIAG